MPSLRRSASSPTVRASPYPLALSATNSAQAAAGSRPRRAASYIAARRVLADIEWWRVLDGQHAEEHGEADHDHDQDTQFGLDEVEASSRSLNQDQLQDNGVDTVWSSSSVTPGATVEDSFETSSLMTPFAALSISAIAPMTPTRSRHSRDGSDSSTESTPEQPHRHLEIYPDSLEGLEGLGLGPAPRPSMLQAMRSLSLTGFPTAHPTEDRFGDVEFL